MLKTAFLYRIHPAWAMPATAAIEDALGAARFTPCGPTQPESFGWVEPRGQQHGALLEQLAGHCILAFQTETRSVPASAIKEKLMQRVAAIEEETGRKPGGKEKREIKDDIKLELLPRAFTKTAVTKVWLDPRRRLLVVGAGSASRCDKVVSALVEALANGADGIFLQTIQTNVSPQAAMSQWLANKEAPHAFAVDRECELKAADESRAAVKYSRHTLEIDEIVEHVRRGKVATQLGMTWNNRVSFVLTEFMVIKKIEFLDVVIEGAAKGPGDQEDDHFDADVAIATGELGQMIPDLLDALGGEVEAAAA